MSAALQKTAYVAGKYGGKLTENAMYYVRSSGYDIPYNWQVDLRPSKPYLSDENREANAEAARDMLHHAAMCRLFVLVVEDNLYGAMTELGAAIESKKLFPTKKIIVTFAPNSQRRESIFFALPEVEVIEWADFLGGLTEKTI